MEGFIEFFNSVGDLLKPQYLFEILILFGVIYVFLHYLEGTRGEGILKSYALLMLMFPLLLTIVAEELKIMDRLLVIIRFFGAAAIPALVIIVQPELRRALVRLGQTRFFGGLFKGDTESTVDDLVKAAFRMSKRKIGALIAIEREVGLKNYVEGGTRIDAIVTTEILTTIFFPGSDLHDGAVVVQKERVAGAGCLFPLSESPTIDKRYGARHRAALGVTEETDAIVIVVSEETGVVSFVNRGQMERVDYEQLRSLLLSHLAQLEDRDDGSSTDVVQEAAGARGR